MNLSDAALARELESIPPELRRLLDDELAAGNTIAELHHSFPAPPAGLCLRLTRPVSTRPRAASQGVRFREVNGSTYSGEFSDERGFYFIVEPPGPPPPIPDMDAIRASRNAVPPRAPDRPSAASTGTSSPPPLPLPDRAERFRLSMIIDYEKWHDGIGYELNLWDEASAEERRAILAMVLAQGVRDWRVVEALAHFDTPVTRKVLKSAFAGADTEVRLAILRHAPALVPDRHRVRTLVESLKTVEPFAGLTGAIDQIVEFHPPEVIEALFRGVLERPGGVAVHFAALLTYLHGKASAPFDMEQRPFFLRFNTEDRAEREAVYLELCSRLGVDRPIATATRPKTRTRPRPSPPVPATVSTPAPESTRTLAQRAESIAREAHKGQFRRDGTTPYITHPEAVVARLPGEPDEVIATAWLHDVLEDTRETADSLRASGIPESVVEAVLTLTKDNQTYEVYLARVKANRIARKVKVADMLHNLSDQPTERQILKYAKGLVALLG